MATTCSLLDQRRRHAGLYPLPGVSSRIPADNEILDWAQREGRGSIHLVHEVKAAVSSADVLYTDVWASMGQEGEEDERKKIFRSFQINEELLAAAPSHAMVLHCLPAHRGEEITAGVRTAPSGCFRPGGKPYVASDGIA